MSRNSCDFRKAPEKEGERKLLGVAYSASKLELRALIGNSPDLESCNFLPPIRSTTAGDASAEGKLILTFDVAIGNALVKTRLDEFSLAFWSSCFKRRGIWSFPVLSTETSYSLDHYNKGESALLNREVFRGSGRSGVL